MTLLLCTLQAEPPAFLQHVAAPLERAGQQLRLLAGLPPALAGDLAPQLAASAAAECAAAAAAASNDPWAGVSCVHQHDALRESP